jgi:NADH:ubiquinone reductase (non-electrogenic)
VDSSGRSSAGPSTLSISLPSAELDTLSTVLAHYKGLQLITIDAYLSRHPPHSQLSPDPNKKTLVVLGSGWGSTSLLKGLNTEDYNVIVVSPRNYFLFTRTAPQKRNVNCVALLPSTTTGLVEARSIMQPIRHILRYKKALVQFFEADCTKIDAERKVLKITGYPSN